MKFGRIELMIGAARTKKCKEPSGYIIFGVPPHEFNIIKNVTRLQLFDFIFGFRRFVMAKRRTELKC